MPPSTAALHTLAQQYPHSADILHAFAPLHHACQRLAADLPPPALPLLGEEEMVQFTQGKPRCLADKENSSIYLDEHVLRAAPELCTLAAQHFPELAAGLEELGTYLAENTRACAHLGLLLLTEKAHRVGPWAKKHQMNKEAAQLLGSQLVQCAAMRVARHAALPAEGAQWDKSHCPVCGRTPQAGFLRHKEGQRFLQCGLCGQSWRFSRTVCPACQDSDPEKRKIFTLQGHPEQMRAEGCEACKHYVLVPDMREMAEEISPSLLLYCLIPMDLLMQEQGYTPMGI